MQDFRKVRITDGEILDVSIPLFTDHEKDRAEAILKALDGLRIVQAQLLLDKVKTALLQMRVAD